MSQQLLAEQENQLNKTLPVEDEAHELRNVRSNLTSPMSDTCIVVSKSSQTNYNHNDLRYPSEIVEMNSTTDDMEELRMRRPLKASHLRHSQKDSDIDDEEEELKQMRDNLSI